MTDTRDELVLLAHGVDKLTGAKTLIESLGELLSGTIKGTTEARANGQETSDQRADEILAGTGGDNGVHGTGHGGTVIGSKHENHLKELGSVVGKTAAEPEKGHDTTNTDLLPKDVRDGHTSVEELLTTVIGNGRNEGSRLTNEAKLLSPRVVDGDLGDNRLGGGDNGAISHKLVIDLLEESRHVLEGVGNVETSLTHALVLGGRSLELRVGEGTSVTELNLGLEHAGASTDGPSNDGLGNDALLDSLDHLVLLNTTDFTEQDKDLAGRVGLVAKEMVNEGGSGVTVTTNGNTLVHTIRRLGDNVVKLVGHATGLGDVANGALAVELGGNNVVHHTTGVTDLEAAGLDTTDGGRADDGDALLLGNVGNLAGTLFKDMLAG